MITGYATIETAVKAIEIGAYDYIAKPFRLDELMVVIKNASERLSLTAQNKVLLDDLRNAHNEIAALKNALASKASGKVTDEGAADGRLLVYAEKEAPNPLKKQEYLREADRFAAASAISLRPKNNL